MLTNPYIIAVVIPFLLILGSAFVKKLIRGTSFLFSDFYLGVDLSFSTMASSLINIFDLTKVGTKAIEDALLKNQENGVFLGFCFFLLIIVLVIHQIWEPVTTDTRWQRIWLGLISNLIGIGLMFSFIIRIKGIN